MPPWSWLPRWLAVIMAGWPQCTFFLIRKHELPNLIKKAQNIIRAYKQRLESYLNETNVRSPIVEKLIVCSPII